MIAAVALIEVGKQGVWKKECVLQKEEKEVPIVVSTVADRKCCTSGSSTQLVFKRLTSQIRQEQTCSSAYGYIHVVVDGYLDTYLDGPCTTLQRLIDVSC